MFNSEFSRLLVQFIVNFHPLQSPIEQWTCNQCKFFNQNDNHRFLILGLQLIWIEIEKSFFDQSQMLISLLHRKMISLINLNFYPSLYGRFLGNLYLIIGLIEFLHVEKFANFWTESEEGAKELFQCFAAKS